ncbi:hypothetical protein NNC10_004505 [Escherichia coli]|nr:hypothetical protein [Escherichia coli]
MNIREAEQMAVNSMFSTNYDDFWTEHMRMRYEIIGWKDDGNRDEILKTPESSHILGIYIIQSAVLEWLDMMAANAVIVEGEHNNNFFYGVKDDERTYFFPVCAFVMWLYDNTITAAAKAAQTCNADSRNIFFTMVSEIIAKGGNLNEEAAQFLMTAMKEMGRKMANDKPEVTIH